MGRAHLYLYFSSNRSLCFQTEAQFWSTRSSSRIRLWFTQLNSLRAQGTNLFAMKACRWHAPVSLQPGTDALSTHELSPSNIPLQTAFGVFKKIKLESSCLPALLPEQTLPYCTKALLHTRGAGTCKASSSHLVVTEGLNCSTAITPSSCCSYGHPHPALLTHHHNTGILFSLPYNSDQEKEHKKHSQKSTAQLLHPPKYCCK